jgi:hypothetical protein
MTEYVLSLSYGKDSLACLGAIQELGLPLNRIVHAEVWATDTISADLPEMVEFKKKADKIIKERYGIEVEHVYAKDKNGEKLTYEKLFYHTQVRRAKPAPPPRITGFPVIGIPWCNGRLKLSAIQRVAFSGKPLLQGAVTNTVRYFGIAADEPERIERHKDKAVMPLVLAGWDEAFCRKWCETRDLLAPTYKSSLRGGCWFCHNQSIGQLRLLRKNYPEYWELILKWDNDSPVSFKADGHTVHDFDKRFALEDEGLIRKDETFRWSMLEGNLQTSLFREGFYDGA